MCMYNMDKLMYNRLYFVCRNYNMGGYNIKMQNVNGIMIEREKHSIITSIFMYTSCGGRSRTSTTYVPKEKRYNNRD